MADEYDSPWKEILERYFPQFIAFFFPDIYEDVDWERGYEFLDQELQKVVRDAETKARRVDKLVRLWRKSGEERHVLVHVEVQGQEKADFQERLYIYSYRLYDWKRVPVATLAILTDDSPDWRPDRFEYNIWGVQASLRFRIVKLLDYRAQWAALEQDPNPFAVVVMAHLKTQETSKDPEARHQWKFTLTEMLYGSNYSRQDVLELFRFIDWLMYLPPPLAERFSHQLAQLEEERQMPYITSVERIAEARGLEQGLEQGLERGLERGLEQGLEQGQQKESRRNILNILALRFNYVSEPFRLRLDMLNDLAQLQTLSAQAVIAPTLADFHSAADAILGETGGAES